MKYNLMEILTTNQISGLCLDSKNIQPGEAFVALKGKKLDGNNFIEDAFSRGANIVLTDDLQFKYNKLNNKIYYIENIKEAIDLAVKIFYPSLPKNLVGVTGTSGKSSVVSYCKQLIALLGPHSASIGTRGVECSNQDIEKLFDEEKYRSLTTTDLISFRRILHQLASNNINYVAFEASSHGLDQGRLGDIKVKAAAFTNFSHEHLDYHLTMDNYFQAKLKLFTNYLAEEGIAILNSELKDIDYITKILAQNNKKFITIGKDGNLEIISNIVSNKGQEVNFSYKGQNYNFKTEIIGSFQITNLLIASLLIEQIGFDFDQIINNLSKLVAVSGRLEKVTNKNDNFQIFIDYAHKPEALKNILIELLQLLKDKGQLYVVFGCGGDRDRSKREIMGKIATQLADKIIITDDNPRYEDPPYIRQQILKGCRNHPHVIEIPDRKTAIDHAVEELKTGDILLIAGKGDENYQQIKEEKIPFNDAEIARMALERRR